MSVDWTTLCTELGSIIAMQEAIATACGTTVPGHLSTIDTQFSGASADLEAAISSLPGAVSTLQAATIASQSTISTAILGVIFNTLNDNQALPAADATTVITAFAQQFAAGSQSFKPNVVSASTSVGGSNVGNAVIRASVVRGDGLSQQNVLAEVVQGTAVGPTSINLVGQASAGSGLSPLWPGGSGLNLSLTCMAPDNGLLQNSGFDSFTVANTPDNWIITSGTPGTNILSSVYTIQTLTITGSSTSGTYVIAVEDLNSVVQYTAPLAYNATAGQVQSAIQALNGFSGTTVTATGTSPDYTHTITFNGIAGNVPTVSTALNTTGLTLTPATTQDGSAGFVGLALQLTSTGSETQTLYQAVNLQPSTVYCLNFWAKVNTGPTAGVLTLGLSDGIGSSFVDNGQSVTQSTTVGHAALSTSWTAYSVFFQTPAELPSQIYFKLAITTATTSGTVLWLDQMCLVQATELYTGGAFAAAFQGSVPLQTANLSTVADTFTVTVANNQAGGFVTWFNRNFNLASLEIVLATSGSPTQADTLIA